MKLELNLLENSYDFIEETLSYYKKLGYNESHDPDRDSVEEKKKWKTTFILLVQAVELLIKEKLYRINSHLIFENIDMEKNESQKLIGFSKSIDRLSNLNSKLISEENKLFLKKCGEIRNQFIHSIVKIDSVDIKIKYCKLFELYLKLHSLFFRKKFFNEKYNAQVLNIIQNTKDLIVYRGIEYTKKDIKYIKKSMEEAEKYSYGISKKTAYERLKYGLQQSERDYRYCGDCSATYGEHHTLGCDCEMCPRCGNQLITCKCFKKYYTKEEVKKLFDRKKINKIISFGDSLINKKQS